MSGRQSPTTLALLAALASSVVLVAIVAGFSWFAPAAAAGPVPSEAPPAGGSGAQSAIEPEVVTGPVIEGYGPVVEIPEPDFATPTDHDWKIIFDVKTGAAEPDQLNLAIESVARFLNMHARAGVDPARIQAAIVLHGGAGKDALAHEGYRARYEVDNPNLGLIRALVDAGVEIYLCGQTAAFRGMARGELTPEVQLALSAMTVMGALQADGYVPVAF